MTGKRYQILSELGRGGLGTVYRARDRLEARDVALRLCGALGDGDDRLRFARRVRLLASLHHPHLVPFLDYGFTGDDPYYTMELVDPPRQLLSVGRGSPFLHQIELVIQVLRALAYLHLRGVVHRDLRPSNVLVDGGQVRLVDFGLAELYGEAWAPKHDEVAYRAPELRRGAAATPAADLYSVGVLAFELVAGHPYVAGKELGGRDDDSTDLSTRDFDGRAISVLHRLLLADPGERYQGSGEVIQDLVSALELPPSEAVAVRESHLRAASLVGRSAELELLTHRLEATLDGRGGGVIVQGENGVGKSRLLEELRILGSTRGAKVFAGQPAGDGPYRSWRPILRSLCLQAELDAAEAAVLATQVVDAAELLGRTVPAAPELDPQAAHRRFCRVVGGLFARLGAPAVVLLDDLHRMGNESLALFRELLDRSREAPILVVGAYRPEELPTLTEELRQASFVKLERLSRAGISELAGTILGPAGRRSELVDLLGRTTEGNVHFIVEVLRALAEEAGGLERIDPDRLPHQVTTASIREIIRRRIHRVPRRALPLLRLVAVAGRDVDPQLIPALEPEVQSELWLRVCADAAVLERVEGRWRFVYDELREVVMHDLSGQERRAAHRRVAGAIAQVHAASDEHLATLAHHWSEAADVSDPEAMARAVDALERAGRSAVASCATEEAERWLERGLHLNSALPPAPSRLRKEARLQVDLGSAYMMSRGYAAPEVGQAFSRAKVLCELERDSSQLLPALVGLWRFHTMRGDLDQTNGLAKELAGHAESSRRMAVQLFAEYALGASLYFHGELEAASRRLARVVELDAELHQSSRREVAATVFYLGLHPTVAALGYGGVVHWLLGRPAEAFEVNRRARALAGELDHPFSRAFSQTLTAWLHQLDGDTAATAAAAEIGLTESRGGGFPYLTSLNALFLGWSGTRRGEASAVRQVRRALEELRTTGTELCRPYFLSLLAECLCRTGQVEDAFEVLDAAAERAEAGGAGWWEPEMFRLRASFLLSLPDPNREAAAHHLRQALAAARQRGELLLELRAATDLVELTSASGAVDAAARSELQELCATFDATVSSRDLVAARTLVGE